MTQLERLLTTSTPIRGRKPNVEEFLQEFRKKVLESKAGIESELKTSISAGNEIAKTQFVKKNAVIIRQITSKTEKGAEALDLSSQDGVKNTEDMFFKWKRFEKWLTL